MPMLAGEQLSMLIWSIFRPSFAMASIHSERETSSNPSLDSTPPSGMMVMLILMVISMLILLSLSIFVLLIISLHSANHSPRIPIPMLLLVKCRWLAGWRVG